MRGTHTAGVRSEGRTSSEARKAERTRAWEEVSATNQEALMGCGGRGPSTQAGGSELQLRAHLPCPPQGGGP